MKMTYTYTLMEVPQDMFDLVRKKMMDAGYAHALHDGGNIIDMHGLALTVSKTETAPPADKGDPKKRSVSSASSAPSSERDDGD